MVLSSILSRLLDYAYLGCQEKFDAVFFDVERHRFIVIFNKNAAFDGINVFKKFSTQKYT